MAFIDDSDNAVVLRLVYAGPPMSGKTESVRALSRLLLDADPSDAVFTPGEANERTLFFDWLEYSGGSFQGHRIRCQIVSVPGQSLLQQRRRALIESADAIVFVIDAHVEQSAAIVRSFGELQQITAATARDERVGIVVQANKSDLPNALDKHALAALLGDGSNMIVIPSVATQGAGVREAFVRAVSLGLARAHAQMAAGTLASAETVVNSGEALLRQLVAVEEARYGAVGASARRDAVVSVAVSGERDHFESEKIVAMIERYAHRVTDERSSPAAGVPLEASSNRWGPAPPDDRLDSGMVWPPIAGRIVLHEISAHSPEVVQSDDQSWVAYTADRWQLRSLPHHCYPTQAEAREELLRQARTHARYKTLLSEHRCVCGAPTGAGDWRIWQVVRRETTLADIVRLTLGLKSPESVAAELLRVGRLLRRAVELFSEAGLPSKPTLDSLAVSHGNPVYTRFLSTAEVDAGARVEHDVVELLRTELKGAVATLAKRGESASSLLRQLEAARAAAQAGDIVPETLIALFLQHG
jgi:signal recognition particle receptor subunit beta